MSFHNTLSLTVPALAAAERRASSQEVTVLAFYRDNPERMFSPSMVHKACFDWNTPLTSIRRSITNLTAAGLLRKSEMRVPGPYGMSEHCWYYPRPRVRAEQMGLFV